MIDLCIVNHNTMPQLQRLLSNLYGSLKEKNITHPWPWNIYLMDNGSTDGSRQWIESLIKHNNFFIKDIILGDNIGYAQACNRLASYGDAPVVALLNADVWFTHQDLLKIEDEFNRNSAVGILGPKQRDEKGSVTHAGIFGSNTHPMHRGWKVSDPEDLQYRDKLEAVTVSGSAYFVRRSVWKTLTDCEVYREKYPIAEGAFLPTPHYYEETWCSYHAKAHGFHIYYDGEVSIGHTWHASSPVGGEKDGFFRISQMLFRDMCDHHKIEHD